MNTWKYKQSASWFMILTLILLLSSCTQEKVEIDWDNDSQVHIEHFKVEEKGLANPYESTSITELGDIN